MIDSLSELNEVINNVVTRIVERSTQNTSTGNWITDYSDVSDLISDQDYYMYFELIANELRAREEVLDLDTYDHQFDTIFGLKYCPNYEWCQGDEEIFGCDQAQWERTFQADPVSKPLSMSRLAEIGEKAIAYVMETSDMAVEDLTESIGMSMRELQQLKIYDPGIELPPEPITFEVFDVQKVKTYSCDTIHGALETYKALGDSPFKFIAAAIPSGQRYSGRLMLMHQQDGKDILLNTNSGTPQMRDLHSHFTGTSVEEAFSVVAGYVKSQIPIEFFVWDDRAANNRIASFQSFEAAFDRYQTIPRREKALSYQVYDDRGGGKGASLLQSTEDQGEMVCSIPEDILEGNMHIALAAAKARLALFPNDEKAWTMRDQAEQSLGITERFVDTSQDLLVGKWRVHVIPTGGHYGAHNEQVNNGKPMVSFFDTSCDARKFGPNGQFVSQYYVDTLLGRDGYSTGKYPHGLALDPAVPSWMISASEMAQITEYLRAQEKQMGKQHAPLSARIGDAESRKPVKEQPSSDDRRLER